MAVVVLTRAVQAGLQTWWGVERYGSGVGEQRVVMLGDGNCLSLNMATRLHVEPRSARRSAVVGDAEALFEFAKDAPAQP